MDIGNHNSKPICSQNGLNRRQGRRQQIPARLRTICRELDLIFPFFLKNLSHRDRRQGRKPPSIYIQRDSFDFSGGRCDDVVTAV